MAKNGYKIFDSDTHVGPFMEVLDKYVSDTERSKLAGWEELPVPADWRAVLEAPSPDAIA